MKHMVTIFSIASVIVLLIVGLSAVGYQLQHPNIHGRNIEG